MSDRNNDESDVIEDSLDSSEELVKRGDFEEKKTKVETRSRKDTTSDRLKSDHVDHDEVDDADEVVFSNDNESDVADPLGPAYDLEDGSIIETTKEDNRSKVYTKISTLKEFFESEIHSRFELLNEGEKESIKGHYRLEVRGNEGGVWTINLSDSLEVISGKKNADIVLMMLFEDFISIVNGKINPQIALSSRRVKINGDSRKASLFQNILAPRAL